jgi:hypothetical protein
MGGGTMTLRRVQYIRLEPFGKGGSGAMTLS